MVLSVIEVREVESLLEFIEIATDLVTEKFRSLTYRICDRFSDRNAIPEGYFV